MAAPREVEEVEVTLCRRAGERRGEGSPTARPRRVDGRCAGSRRSHRAPARPARESKERTPTRCLMLPSAVACSHEEGVY
jgi:hypothetical protein